MNLNKPKLILASAYSALVTIIFVVIITIWAEESAPLKDWLKNFSGHHWTTKSIFSLLLFGVMGFLLYITPTTISDKKTSNSIRITLIWTILGCLALTLYYTAHHLGWI